MAPRGRIAYPRGDPYHETMRILLVNPLQARRVGSRGKIYNRVWPPLSEANCAALLEREGHEAAILDANAEGIGPEDVGRRAAGFDKVFVTSSAIDRWQCPVLDLGPFLDAVEAVRKTTDEVYVTGAHGTVRPEEMLERTGAKAVIRGEPELTVTELCGTDDLSTVRGIAYRSGGRFVDNGPREPLDLKSLPLPAFHLLPMDRYYYEVLGDRFTLLEASRGCDCRCSFCLLAMYGDGLRVKTAGQVIDELEAAIRRFHVRTAYFMDLEFTAHRGLVEEVCDHLIAKRHDFRWTCQTRLDRVDDDLLMNMKRAGCDLIHFGVEAADDRTLKALGKGLTVERIVAGMEAVKRHGIRSACFFLMGLPGSTMEDLDEIVRFAIRLDPTYALFHIAIPYPGTRLHAVVSRDGGSFSDDGPFPEACVGAVTLPDLKKAIRKAYARFYLRPRYVLSTLGSGRARDLWKQMKLFSGFVSGR